MRNRMYSFDGSQYDSVLESNDMAKVSGIVNSLNIKIKSKNYSDEKELLRIKNYIKIAQAKVKVIGQMMIISMTERAIETNEGNPRFNVAEYENKLKEQKATLDTLKSEFEAISVGAKKSFFAKNKIAVMVVIGASIFIGYKMYKKYKK